MTKDDVILLEQVACQVAIAVENTLQYEKATKDRDKETKQRLYLEEEIRAQLGEIVGQSPALKTALSLVSVVAPTDSSVLIQERREPAKNSLPVRYISWALAAKRRS